MIYLQSALLRSFFWSILRPSSYVYAFSYAINTDSLVVQHVADIVASSCLHLLETLRLHQSKLDPSGILGLSPWVRHSK